MPQEISAHLRAVCGSRHSSKSVGVRGPSVLVCASRKSSLCRTGLGKVVPASSRSMRKQHPLLLACLPPKHLYSYRHLSTSREKLRKSIIAMSLCKSKHCSMWVVCLSASSVMSKYCCRERRCQAASACSR